MPIGDLQCSGANTHEGVHSFSGYLRYYEDSGVCLSK